MMLTENQPARKSLLKNAFVYSSLVILIVAIYVGWILLSRNSVADIEGMSPYFSASDPRKKGGNNVKDPVEIKSIRLSPDAKTVTLEPQSGKVWPSHNLCIDVKPTKTTTYTLTANGTNGKTISQQVTVEVR